MTWVIVRDHLHDDDPETFESEVGVGQWEGEKPDASALPHRAKLYDDDGELYYTIAFDDAAEERDDEYGGLYEAYRWAEANAGATDLRIKGESIYG